jgi:glutamyl-Q tRNA(Asp) synthetase
MVVALASWLDAKAHNGTWIIRIEDLDQDRCIPGVDHYILKQLSDCNLHSTVPVQWQSQRRVGYENAFRALKGDHMIYPCHCTRAQILSQILSTGATPSRHQSKIYPGTCRPGAHEKNHKTNALTQLEALKSISATVAWRFKSSPGELSWTDRRLGRQIQDVSLEVGDFVIKRADAVWAYQLSVVVDDALSQVTHIVRGADLVDNTARQIQLQKALGYPRPQYLHTQLILGPNGEKLSKQNGATPADTNDALSCLNTAAVALGLQRQVSGVADALEFWVHQWSDKYC